MTSQLLLSYLCRHDVPRHVVDVAPVHKKVAVVGVAERRQQPRVRHGCATILPEQSARMYAFPAHRDVGRHAEEGQPQVLDE